MRRNSIWITGAPGKIGTSIMRRLKKNVDYRIIATGRDVDVTDLESVQQHMNIYKPNIVINCASVSDVYSCEENPVEAFRVNALGARNLATASRQDNAKIIHLSCDDVFSGEHAIPKTEFDVPTPVTVYGKSKLAGENFVRELNPRHLIIRSSWVYGGGDDYISYVLEKAAAKEPFTAAFDKISTPTSSDLIARFIELMLDKKEYGIYHASCEGACTRYEYARMILYLTGNDISLVSGTFAEKEGLTTTTLLENLMMKMTGVFEMPDWKEELRNYVKVYINKKES